MTSVWRALRRRVLTPSVAETTLEKRGFHIKSPAARELLETVGESFLTGYAHAMEVRHPAQAEERLEAIPARFRGFAYEGAGMGFAMLDGLLPGRGGRCTEFLAGRADDHIYTAYVGIGWAMARLPRFRWSRLRAPDPLVRWLVLDGYGFHQAYFRTRKYVHQHHREVRVGGPVDDPTGYGAHVIDQGIGRALWFVAGSDADVATILIEGFSEDRRGDLYSGAALAATYACGADEAELRRFRDRSGPYRLQVAQGSAFAADARVRGGIVLPETGVATGVLCGVTPEEAARICAETRPAAGAPEDEGAPPGWEVWRRAIADVFAGRAVKSS